MLKERGYLRGLKDISHGLSQRRRVEGRKCRLHLNTVVSSAKQPCRPGEAITAIAPT
jgi:hypothetical protein